ncbi:unnamed protein product [Arctogadus glacialis]
MLEGGRRGRQREDGAAPGPPVRRAVGWSVVRWVGRSDPRYGRGASGVMRGSRPPFLGPREHNMFASADSNIYSMEAVLLGAGIK